VRPRRWLELGFLFGLMPWILSRAPRWTVLPFIVAGGAFCVTLLLRDPTFRRSRLLGAAGVRPGLPRIVIRTIVVWTALVLFTLVVRGPQALFRLPRTQPLLWLAIMILYPVLSAYPQELVYRTFFFHRYAGLFRRPVAMVLASAALFGWAHVMAHNSTAALLASVGGLLFASTYARTRSTLLATIEHSLYGNFVFTVGLGDVLTSGVHLGPIGIR
jgi:membrane protease YdiL (CAAX protease family)